ncbi:MAG: succinate dehydrogenase assembly factor 2 [Rhodospirillales bacterium]
MGWRAGVGVAEAWTRGNEGMSEEDLAIRVKRLRYRSWHRGTKELDLLLGPFADESLPESSGETMDTFEVLLDLPEPLLYSLLTGEAEPAGLAGMPGDFVPLVESIRAFHARPKRL